MMGPYDDIINMPHYTSPKRPRMNMEDRAAQFSPFAALTGYGDVIKETARLTDRKIELTEDARSDLDEKIQFFKENQGKRPKGQFTYFLKDKKKEGGAYVEAQGIIKRINEIDRQILLLDGKAIPIEDILEIELLKEEQR